MYALLVDQKFAEQMIEVFDTSYFDLKYLVFLSDRYFAYAKKHHTFPTMSLLIMIIKEDLKKSTTDIVLRDQIVDYLKRMRSDINISDLPYVKEKSLDFCRKQALKQALEQAIDHVASSKYEQIVDLIKKAVSVGTIPNMGHEFFRDFDVRFTQLKRDCVATGFDELDRREVFNGGLAKGECGVVVAATGVGKCVDPRECVSIRYRTGDEVILEDIELGKLFERLGYASSVEPTDESGDSVFDVSALGIEVLSDEGFHLINAIRWTKPEKVVELRHCRSFVPDSDALTLTCSPDHVIMTGAGWQPVKMLRCNDLIVTRMGFRRVCEVYSTCEEKRLCDIQVSHVAKYYVGHVLSHNSHMLTFFGANALRQGLNVMHYTFELSEAAVGIRYDSNLCDIDSNKIIDQKDDVLKIYQESKFGQLYIKQFPPNMVTIHGMRAHLEKLVLHGFRPHLIIVDYADIMRSSRQFDSLRHELRLVYEELRGFAVEEGYAIWTASQSNREGSNSEIVDLTNMSEAYGKAMVADIVISISRKPHEKAAGIGRLFVAKNRAGKDGLVYPIRLDTAKSKFEIVGEVSGFDAERGDDETRLKAAIREKLNDIKYAVKEVQTTDSLSEPPPPR